MKLKIRRGCLWLPLLMSCAPAALAQSSSEKVSSIVVTNIGPRVASDDLVRANIHLKKGDPYVRSSVDQDVLNLYGTGHFSNIRVTEEHTDKGVVVTYSLQGKLQLTGITFVGNTRYSTYRLSKKISSKVGDSLDERKLFNDCLEIQKTYEKAGYRNTVAKYVTGNFDYEAGRASVTFQITESPRIRIQEVDFPGAKAFSQRKLRKQIKTRDRWFFSWLTGSGVFKEDQFQEDKEALAKFYRDKGYIDFEIKDIKITNPTPRWMKIAIEVFEGSPYKVGKVTFSGNKIFPTDQIVAAIKKAREDNHSTIKVGIHSLEADDGLVFTPTALDSDIKAIEDFYGSKGYINVREGSSLRVIKTPNTETGTMDIKYEINEGEKVYVEKILIRGNVKTKDKVIRRELAVWPGEPFDMVKVRRSKERLEELTYFEKVDTKPSPTDIPNHQDLIVGVDEKSTGNISFGAGFNSVENLFGYLELTQRNFDLFKPPYFTGAGQKLRLLAQLGTRLQDYEIGFTEPWFLERKLVLGVNLYRRVQNYLSLNELYDVTSTGLNTSLTRALGSDFLIGSVGYTFEQVGINNVNTNAPTTIMNEAGYRFYNRLNGSLSYDTRNSYGVVSKGQKTAIEGGISVGNRDFYRLEFKTEWFFRGLARDHVLEFHARTGVTDRISGGDVPFDQRFYLGGQDTLRGFDFRGVGPREVLQDGTGYEPIGGDTYWFASAEYTIPLISHLSFAMFYDIGQVGPRPFNYGSQSVYGNAFNSASTVGVGSPLQPGLANGHPFAGTTGSFSDDFGFGIRLNIPTLGPLRLDYGIPLTHDRFNGPSGKIQFGVGFQRPL